MILVFFLIPKNAGGEDENEEGAFDDMVMEAISDGCATVFPLCKGEDVYINQSGRRKIESGTHAGGFSFNLRGASFGR